MITKTVTQTQMNTCSYLACVFLLSTALNQHHLLIKACGPLQCVSDIRGQIPWFLGAAP